jgi:hypothetical protein
MSSMNIAIPQIQSAGPPPSLHADRIAGEMVRWLIAEREARWRQWWAEWERGSIGNPKGQQRMWRRMVEAAGPFLLFHRLVPGKRARFELEVLEAAGWDPEARDVIGAHPDRATPARPWLAVTTTGVKWLRPAPRDRIWCHPPRHAPCLVAALSACRRADAR